MPKNPLADNAAGTWLESAFSRHPNLTTACTVVAILLLQVVGALLDGAPQ